MTPPYGLNRNSPTNCNLQLTDRTRQSKPASPTQKQRPSETGRALKFYLHISMTAANTGRLFSIISFVTQ